MILHRRAADLTAQALTFTGQTDVSMLYGKVRTCSSNINAAHIAAVQVQMYIFRRSIGKLAGNGRVLRNNFTVLYLQRRIGGLFLWHFRTTGSARSLAVIHGRSLHFLIDRSWKDPVGDSVNQFHD